MNSHMKHPHLPFRIFSLTTRVRTPEGDPNADESPFHSHGPEQEKICKVKLVTSLGRVTSRER